MKKRLTPMQTIIIGFAIMILFGTLLLKLPIASRDRASIPLLSALFTATSATCVTGLSLYDTWTQFSIFGQAVILFLIQIGGLGFMTAVVSVALVMHRRIGLQQRAILTESIGTWQLSGIVRLSKRAIFGTAIFEGLGAIIFSVSFIPVFGWKRGIWMSVFHAVSAFCNAGFDLMGAVAPSSSLVAFNADVSVLLTASALILIGGIGFIVWNDILELKNQRFKLSFHSTLVLIMTLILTLVGFVLMGLIEWDVSLSGMSTPQKILNAFFMAVTPRTAGFSAVDISSMSDAGKALTMVLMFIGAAPGGTGGGIKVTTIAVVALSLIASLKQKGSTSIGKYRVEEKTVMRALSIFMLYFAIETAAAFVLCLDGVDMSSAVFECISAIATVGLSTGITAGLGTASKLVLILLMYIGRVGGLTLFFAMNRNGGDKLKNAVGKVIVG